MRKTCCTLVLTFLVGVSLAKDDQKESEFDAVKAKLLRDVKQLLAEKKHSAESPVAQLKTAVDEKKRAELYIQNAMVEVNPGDICYRKSAYHYPGYPSYDWSSSMTFPSSDWSSSSYYSSPDWSSSSWYYPSSDWSSSSWYYPSSDWSSSSWYYPSSDWSSSSWYYPSSDWYSSSWYYPSSDWSSSSWYYSSSDWSSSSWYYPSSDWSSSSWYYPSSDWYSSSWYYPSSDWSSSSWYYPSSDWSSSSWYDPSSAWSSSSSSWNSYSSYDSYSMYDPTYAPYMYPVEPALFTGEDCGYNYWFNEEYHYCVWEDGCGYNIWTGYKRGFKRVTGEQRHQRLRMLRELSSNQKRMPVAKSESPRKQEVERENKLEVAQHNKQDAINRMLHKKFEAFKHMQEKKEMAGKNHDAKTLNENNNLRGNMETKGLEKAKIRSYLRGLMARERMGKNGAEARMEGNGKAPNKA